MCLHNARETVVEAFRLARWPFVRWAQRMRVARGDR